MTTDLQHRVRAAIAASAATHRDFARSVGMDPTKLSKSLSGVRRFTVDELTIIADVAQVPLQWLLDGTGPGPVANDGADLADDVSDPAASRAGDRRTRFLDAATRLIAENGYHAVRISDIAQACGTSSGAVHYHFPAKDDILTSALRYCVEQALTRQNAELQGERDARRRLARLVELQLPKSELVRREWLVWLHFWTESALRQELRDVHNEFYFQWRGEVVQTVLLGQQQGTFRGDVDAEAFSVRFTALIDGLAVQIMVGMPGVTVDGMRSELLGVIERELVPGNLAPGSM